MYIPNKKAFFLSLKNWPFTDPTAAEELQLQRLSTHAVLCLHWQCLPDLSKWLSLW